MGFRPAFVRGSSQGEAIEVVTDAGPLSAPDADDLKRDVQYRGLPDWVGEKLNSGAALDPRDEDPIHELR